MSGPKENVDYFAERNRRIMQAKREHYDRSGLVTTLRTATVGGERGEPAYIIPTYDPITRTVMPIEDAYRAALPDIKAGKLKPYKTWQDAEKHLNEFYPSVIRSHLPPGDTTTPIGGGAPTRLPSMVDQGANAIRAMLAQKLMTGGVR